jgi:hypothetical protein
MSRQLKIQPTMSPTGKLIEFQVWIACKNDCADYEPAHKLLLLQDSLSAIIHANSNRDETHETWIEVLY